MAKKILLNNPVTVGLANELAKVNGKSPHATADWVLQQALRVELAKANRNHNAPKLQKQ